MHYMVSMVLVGVLSLNTFPLAAASAQTPPAQADNPLLARFKEQGKIDRIDESSLTMVVGDKLYKMGMSMEVYTGAGQRIGVHALKKGTRVAFNAAWPDPKVTPIITQVLILSH
jgi:hypothetical protein